MLYELFVVVTVNNFFFFKQKTAYEMRISDWSSDVCSSDLVEVADRGGALRAQSCDDVAEPTAQVGHPDVGAVKPRRPRDDRSQIGRASCRERVCQYV